MKKTVRVIVLIAVMASFAFIAHTRYQLTYPEYFPAPVYDLEAKPLSAATIELGRTLFYDTQLSGNNTISCASCHSPFNAFAHTDHDLSHGINDSIGTRNAPPLFNLAWGRSFMWDGAINHLDMQALAPISSETEMGSSIEEVVYKLQGAQAYKTLFQDAYLDTTVTGERVLLALAQFQLSLVSSNSKYDQMRQGKMKFTEQEMRGQALFMNQCNACHTAPLFTNAGFSTNNLPIDLTLNDFGKATVTAIGSDSLQFKVPSLRNLSYTFPYMHDGRFQKLNEVLLHYNEQTLAIMDSDNSEEIRVRLSSNDKADMIAFLLTLNDSEFVFNSKHQIPKEFFIPAKD